MGIFAQIEFSGLFLFNLGNFLFGPWSFAEQTIDGDSEWTRNARLRTKSKISHLLRMSIESTANIIIGFGQYDHQNTTLYPSMHLAPSFWTRFEWWFLWFFKIDFIDYGEFRPKLPSNARTANSYSGHFKFPKTDSVQ